MKGRKKKTKQGGKGRSRSQNRSTQSKSRSGSARSTRTGSSRQSRSGSFSRNSFPPSPEYYYDEDPKRDFSVLLKRNGYRDEFEHGLLKQAAKIKDDYDKVVGIRKTIEGRVDLRKDLIFTIDGEDAKDFDDAVSLKVSHYGGSVGNSGQGSSGGDWTYQLGVHIADVSHFVKIDSQLDLSARDRGNSVYLIEYVLPMFPEDISNYVCSLMEAKDRMTVTCLMDLDQEGSIIRYKFFRSVIKSRRRLTYQAVEKYLSTGEVANSDSVIDEEIGTKLKEMETLKTLLRKKRIREGSIDFISQEQYFEMNNDQIKNVIVKKQLNAEKLIEEFMLMANQCAARKLEQGGIGIYRVHEPPKEESLTNFERTLNMKGYELSKQGFYNPMAVRGQKNKPNRYGLFLESIKEEPEQVQSMFSMLLLRSMNQAKYSAQPLGHYGLAFSNYTHFTSPIRRYPDLMVHRALVGELRKQPLKIQRRDLRFIAKHSSQTERRAVEIEREYGKVKSMRYLAKYLIDESLSDTKFDGQISGFSPSGKMFIRLKDTGIEGMVDTYGVDSWLEYDSEENCLKLGGKVVYEVGEEIEVTLISLDFHLLHVNFSLLDYQLKVESLS